MYDILNAKNKSKYQMKPSEVDQPNGAFNNVIIHHGICIESINLHEAQWSMINLMSSLCEASDSATPKVDPIPKKRMQFCHSIRCPTMCKVLMNQESALKGGCKNLTMIGFHFNSFLRKIMAVI